MNIEQIVIKYANAHSEKSFSRIADLILAGEDNVELSHRTLRAKIGAYLNSKDDEPIKYTENSWNQEDTVAYFMAQDALNYPEGGRKLQPYVGGNPNNVLVLGDTQFPFHREGYLEHCRAVQEQYDCGTVVHIGDVADNHYSSFHETNPDGYGAGEELDRVIAQTKEWHRVFPNAKVCIGNHDAIINRQAVKAGISSRWIKGLADVFETPTWEYLTEWVFNGTMYTHTLGTNALQAALLRQVNLVVGHEHATAEIKYAASLDKLFWAMKVGAGVDDRKYAFNYAKTATKKSIMSCGVVIGNVPHLIPMQLKLSFVESIPMSL